ncbi:MAG: response regulator [Saprospiraceae bacterium]
MIHFPLRILLIEDNISDTILIDRQIKKILSSPKIKIVTSFEGFVDSIKGFKPDVILSDYQLNGFTGLEILEYVRLNRIYTPFIFITGTINDEELAASTILTGATGYILKKHINTLSQKLLPYIKKIVTSKEKIKISKEQNALFSSMHDYIEAMRRDNEMMRADYEEMKKALDKIKAQNK